MKILHIGYGKTATTSLQKDFFPKFNGYTFNNPKILYLINKYIHTNDIKIKKQLNDFDDFIVSYESLIGWDPQNWEKMRDILFYLFGPDILIVISLKNTESLLNSLYIQQIQEGHIIKEDCFFSNKIPCLYTVNSVDVNLFDYEELVNLYTNLFDNVFVLSLNDFNNGLQLLSRLLSSDNIDFNIRKYNQSLPECIVKLYLAFPFFFSKNNHCIFKKNLNIHDFSFFSDLPYSQKLPQFFKRLYNKRVLRFFLQNLFKLLNVKLKPYRIDRKLINVDLEYKNNNFISVSKFHSKSISITN